jgi:hypothetical protein
MKLPVSAWAFAKLSTKIAQHFYVPPNRSKVEGLCSLVTSVIDFKPRNLSQEPFVAHAVNHCILDPLLDLDELLSIQARIGLNASRDRGAGQTGTSRKTPSGQPLRPDGMLFGPDGRTLLIKWEEKDGIIGMSVAAKELGSKTAVWTRLYYGSLEYLLCFAAGGSSLQFHVVERGRPGAAVPVGSLYNLTKASDRALLAVTVFNLHALLAAVARSLPASVLPVGEEQVVENEAANYKRTLLFRSDSLTALKTIRPWQKYADYWGVVIKELQAVYKKTAKATGIVHATIVNGPKVTGSTYSVELQPLGLQSADCRPNDETEAKHAAHGLLHGLSALHSAGFVHRDLRWENVAADFTKTRYFLLDLELCGRLGAKPKFHLSTWGADTLVEGMYTAASDLTQLGKLLQSHTIRSTKGQHFLQKLQVPASALKASAAGLLRHSWIGCSGASCVAAGALPDER